MKKLSFLLILSIILMSFLLIFVGLFLILENINKINKTVYVDIELSSGFKEDKPLVEENLVEEIYFYPEYEMARIFSDLREEYERMEYVAFCKYIIKNFYNKERVQPVKQMKEYEIELLANELYILSQLENYKGDRFLPLAFALVETRFIPSAVGKAGEKSLFQIMEKTGDTLVAKHFPEKYKEHLNTDLRTDIVMSTYMWAYYYIELYNRVEKLNSTLTEEEYILWVSSAYNCGFWTKGLQYSIKNNISYNKWNKKYRKGTYRYGLDITSTYKEIKRQYASFSKK